MKNVQLIVGVGSKMKVMLVNGKYHKMEWEQREAIKKRRNALFMNKSKHKCAVCGYYLCSCQVDLSDWLGDKVGR